MTDLRKAAEMLMKALDDGWVERGDNVAIALRQALAQPEQPMSPEHLPRYVATNGVKPMEGGGGGGSQPEPDWTTDTPIPPFKYLDLPEYKTTQPEQEPVCDKDPYYCGYVRCQLGKVCKNTAPPKREWVGLTDEERRRYNDRLSGSGVAEEIEAKLKEKNT